MSDRPYRRVTRRDPCPACGKGDWCLRYDDGAVWCGRRESETACKNGGWMHWPAGRPDDWREQLAALPPPPPRPTYDPDTLHAIYGALLERCPLADRHREAMLAKGYRAEEIAAAGHGSLPAAAADRARIAAEIEAATGIALAGNVPGFVIGPLGVTVAAERGKTGRLIPVRDQQDRIWGMRLRLDDVTSGKYRWLSGFDGGASIDGSTVHHAMPRHDHGAGFVGITEGEDKANIAALRLGIPMLSIAGIGQQAHIAAAVRETGARYVAIYFDRDPDPDTRATVAAAEERLARLLAEEIPGIAVLQAVWPEEAGKGLDDCLLAGLVPFTVSHPALAATSEADRARIAELEHANRNLLDENRLINRLITQDELGGDKSGGTMLRLVNYAAAVATSKEMSPGAVIPLVASQIAREFYDPVTQQSHEPISRTTINTRIKEWVEKGVIPTTPVDHTYTTTVQGRDGVTREVEKTITVPGLVWPGSRAELLRMVDGKSVLAPGETRNRGGNREKRLPIVCPSCESTKGVACVECGSIFAAATVAGDHVTLATELVQPVEASQPDLTWTTRYGEPGERYYDGEAERDGGQPDLLGQADPEQARRDREAIARGNRREARSHLQTLRARGAKPRLVNGTLDYDERTVSERLQGRVSEVRGEIEEELLLEELLQGSGASDHPDQVGQPDPATRRGPTPAGEEQAALAALIA